MASADMESQIKINQSWGGRFAHGPAAAVSEFTDSQHYDRILYAHDIRASKAHARMLGKQGIISPDDVQKILDGLDLVEAEINAGKFVWKRELEDVHMNIESRLTELIGDAGKKLHTGRSRNDQVGLTYRMYVADCCQTWIDLCVNLCAALCTVARAHQDMAMPGFTHFQPAQPVCFAHHLLAYASMLRRDSERLNDSLKRIRVSPLGAAALAGSTYPLDPEMVAAEVGFPAICSNSMDAVSDRDFVLEALFDASLIIMHLSRFCEELVIWSNPAFGFISLPDEYSTGSSIMPQKKNPDVAELIRGKTGRIYGHLMGMLTVMKGLPLSYNRDMQEDKEGFLDTDATIRPCLRLMADMLPKIRFNGDSMTAACKKGYLNATELADYLVTRGVPFREAHHITGQAVALAESMHKGLEELDMAEFRQLDPRINDDVYQILDYAACVRRRETPGGTGPISVRKQLHDFDLWLEAVNRPTHAAK